MYFESHKPVFTYLLTAGISKEALGMFIVQNEGIVEILRQAAKNSIQQQSTADDQLTI